MALIQATVPESRPNDPSWLSGETWMLSLAVTLVPFAGIAFLWFMGVIRDHFGEAEDRFFATVFLGSGLLLLASMFVWIALLGSAVAAAAYSSDWPDGDAFVFVSSMIDIMASTIMLRMAGVFVLSTSTIWIRSRVMAKWVGILGFVVAATLLIGGDQILYLRFLFPLWVLLVSLLILVAVRNRDQNPGSGA
ncbi:MAG: hypothetical protein ACR2N9_08020 [Acidimicrobiia bacterium]